MPPSLRLVVPTVCLAGLIFLVAQLFQRDLIPRPRLHITSVFGSNHDANHKDASRPKKPAAPAAVPASAPPTITKTIVMAAMAHENVTWVADELSDWNRAIYIVDAEEAGVSTDFRVPRNKGNEGNAYLWYLLEHYDNLPDVMVFLHAHRDGKGRAWHVDNAEHSNVLSMQRLRLDSVLDEGFLNLRCIQIPGCPKGVRPNYAGDPRPEGTLPTADFLPAALRYMFPDGFPVPDVDDVATREVEGDAVAARAPARHPAPPPYYPEILAAPCCAQFAVSREQVLQRPKSDYARFHAWLMATELENPASGRVMELLWHVIFGRPAYYCPKQSTCGCKNYGSGCKS